MNPEQHHIETGIRRTVGVSALKRLRRLVDADNAQEQANARWARRLGLGFLIAAAGVVLWLARRHF